MTDAGHVAENQRYWDGVADQWISAGETAWASTEPYWGAWRVSDADYPLLPGDMSGMDAIELGCGTAYVSAWMTRCGAKSVTAIDNSSKQLETASRVLKNVVVEIGGQARHSQDAESATPRGGMKDSGTQ